MQQKNFWAIINQEKNILILANAIIENTRLNL